MKEIYSFIVNRKKETLVPFIAKDENGKSIESSKKIVEEIPHKVFMAKPSMSMIEEAEFFYGQKFNELINAGFLTKAMLSKKMGDLGGLSSKITIEGLQKSIVDNMESSRVIEFYGGSNSLSEEQKEKLKTAEETFAITKTQVLEYEQAIRSQFSQTADVKAEQKLIEWLVFHLSFFEEEVDAKKEPFPLFEGDTFEEKKASYLELCESLEDISDPKLFKVKAIFDESFQTLVRVASIWYNKIAEKQEDIEKSLKELFAGEEKEIPPSSPAPLLAPVAVEEAMEDPPADKDPKTRKPASKKPVEASEG